MAKTKAFVHIEDENPVNECNHAERETWYRVRLKYRIALSVLSVCNVVLLIVVCILSIVLQQQGSTTPNNNNVPVINIPERIYYCDIAQKKSGVCTQFPFTPTTRSSDNFGQPKLSLDECNLICGGRGKGKSGGDILASLWPLPTTQRSLLSPTIARGTCPRQDWSFQFTGAGSSDASGALLQEATGILLGTLESQYDSLAMCGGHGSLGPISMKVHVETAQTTLQLNTDESYKLSIDLSAEPPSVTVTATTFFGARHAFETLTQLVARPPTGYSKGLSMVQSAVVEDAPAFTYRGVMLDTSRHFLPISTLQASAHSTTLLVSKTTTMH